jgi:hypothetical protein
VLLLLLLLLLSLLLHTGARWESDHVGQPPGQCPVPLLLAARHVGRSPDHGRWGWQGAARREPQPRPWPAASRRRRLLLALLLPPPPRVPLLLHGGLRSGTSPLCWLTAAAAITTADAG